MSGRTGTDPARSCYNCKDGPCGRTRAALRNVLQSVFLAIGVAVAASLLLLVVPALLWRLGVAGGLTDARNVRWWYSQPAIALASLVLSLVISRRFFDADRAADAAMLYVLCTVVVAVAAPLATWTLFMALNFV